MSQRIEGTPQVGPLSPLLSNIVFDELDKELERRGIRVNPVAGGTDKGEGDRPF